jgi:DNA polymerase-3 subunit delta
MAVNPNLKNKHILLAGEDTQAMKERLEILVKEFMPEDSMNFEIVDAYVDNMDQAVRQLGSVIESLLTLPFFGGGKLIHLKNCNFLVENRQDVEELLVKVIETLEKVGPESARLIITATALDKRKSFYKKFEKLGAVELFEVLDLRKESQYEQWLEEVEQRFIALGLRPETGVVERVVQLIGTNTRSLEIELEKLKLYVHPNTAINLQHVHDMVPANYEALIWDLCDAVTLKQPAQAIKLLRELLYQGESEVGIVAMLSSHLRLAALAKYLIEIKQLTLTQKGNFVTCQVGSQGEALLPKNKKGESTNSYRLARIAGQVKKRSQQELFQAVDTLYQVYFKLLSSGSDRTQALENGVLEIAM